MTNERSIRHIFHPTDLSAGSEVAFHHALRLAVTTHASLTVMHVSDGDEDDWDEMPQVRSTLKKWGLLRNEWDPAELVELGIRVRKVMTYGRDPLKACLAYLEEHPTDLIVLGTHQRAGRMGWLERKVAEPLTRSAGEPTLLVPHGRPGFVEPSSGSVQLHKILLPVAREPDPGKAIQAAARMARELNAGKVEFTLLHIGPARDMPAHVGPEREGWSWRQIAREGDVVEGILQVEKEVRPDLIVMATKGHDGFLDALRGSTTERVLREASCPLLTAIR
jgi:nucleotide-binding universal stress UspA family protein